jgi:hypothetical protein
MVDSPFRKEYSRIASESSIDAQSYLSAGMVLEAAILRHKDAQNFVLFSGHSVLASGQFSGI